MQPDRHSAATDPEGTDQQLFYLQQNDPAHPWTRQYQEDYEDSKINDFQEKTKHMKMIRKSKQRQRYEVIIMTYHEKI